MRSPTRKRRIQVQASSKTTKTRCGFCLTNDQAEFQACPECGALLHVECWEEIDSCPSIGCSHRKQPCNLCSTRLNGDEVTCVSCRHVFHRKCWEYLHRCPWCERSEHPSNAGLSIHEEHFDTTYITNDQHSSQDLGVPQAQEQVESSNSTLEAVSLGFSIASNLSLLFLLSSPKQSLFQFSFATFLVLTLAFHLAKHFNLFRSNSQGSESPDS